ncbi:MAG: CBS domain-containing protein [Gammaproteobacteria bacterium]|nr:CBS domain-containing protein [Gammaproteobacteria bacterium]
MDNKNTDPQFPIDQILSKSTTLKDLRSSSITNLVENAIVRTLAAGEHLFQSGDKYLQKVFILVDGTMVNIDPSGLQENVGPGEFIGLANYLDDNDYSWTTRATTQARVLEIETLKLQDLEQKRSDLFNALNRVIARRLRKLNPNRSITSGALAQPAARVMKSPVASCGPDTSLKQAYLLMIERKIGSLVVNSESGQLIGVLTFSGIAEAMLLSSANPDDSIMKVACEIPHAIDTDTPLWKADEMMNRHGVKYIIVVDGNTPVGIVSQSDVLRAFVSRPGLLPNRIADTNNLKELAELFGQITDVAIEARDTNHRSSAAVRQISDTHLQLQRQAIRLTLSWMDQKGYGPPPADFAVLVMGSGGGRTMLLNPDQDNGIIIADQSKKESKAVDDWFERFCRRMVRNLDRIGYDLCPGDIMASNSTFHKSLSQWKKQIEHNTKKPTEKAARWANILFDFDTLFGNDTLTAELRSHALAEIRKKPRILELMAAHDFEGKPALGIFNQLVSTSKTHGKRRIDIKRNGLRLIADAGRIYALQNGIAVPNTIERFNALVRVGKISDDFKNSILEAHEEMLGLLLTHQINQAQNGKPLDKLIDAKKMTPKDRSALRMAMRAVKRLQDQLAEEFL